MAKIDHAKRNRLARPVQIDQPFQKKQVQGHWAKFDGRWVIGVASTCELPEDMIVRVGKSDGSVKPVRLLQLQGTKQLDHITLNLYSFAQVDDSLLPRHT